MFLREELESLEKAPDSPGYVAKFVAEEKFQVHKHLIIARAAGMNLLTYVAQARGKQEFHLRVHVFHTLFNHKLPFSIESAIS